MPAEDVTVEQVDTRTEWQKLEAAASTDTGDEGEDGFNIGRRDGFSEAVQLIDTLTGGDGEYYASTLPGRGCPDPDAMIANIVARHQHSASTPSRDARTRAEAIRSAPLSEFVTLASSVNDSAPVMSVFAAPEWAELSGDGQQWVAALVRETLARQAEGKL